MKNNTHIVIMAGVIDSRFWPISTPEYPKQFIDILGVGKTLIQLTVERFQPICPVENMWVVTNESYAEIVKQQIPNIKDEHTDKRRTIQSLLRFIVCLLGGSLLHSER